MFNRHKAEKLSEFMNALEFDSDFSKPVHVESVANENAWAYDGRWLVQIKDGRFISISELS